MHRIISLLIGVLTTVLVSSAQKAAIERVEAVPFEVIPAGDRRVDLNQEPCALVHVEVLANAPVANIVYSSRPAPNFRV